MTRLQVEPHIKAAQSSLRGAAAHPWPKPMLVVHHLENSRSQRVLWLLEELGLPYEIVHYKRDATTMMAPPELLAVHPLGKSPVITDGETTVAETGAIVEYILAQYGDGRLLPALGTPEALRYRYWLHFAEGSAMPPLLLTLIFDRIANAPMPFFIKPVARGISALAMRSKISVNSSGGMAEPSAKCSQ